jgi:hypothetical protein
LERSELADLLQISLKATRLDHLFQIVVGIDHFIGQGDREKTGRQDNDDNHQEGHDHCRDGIPLLQEALKFLKEGVEDDGQEDGPYNGSKKGREDTVKEVERESGEKENDNEKNMFLFHSLLISACLAGKCPLPPKRDRRGQGAQYI